MTLFEQAFEQVRQLAEKFHGNHAYYTSASYQEAEARKDFIDKFFIALGWDVNHDEQHNPYEQEVKVEKGQKQQQATAQKRADYAFFTAPNFKDVKFFVEAKKPSVDLKHPDNYFQAIRYGWNANTPVAVLTDFEQFHIIDCRYKPDLRFVFSGHHKEYRYTDYSDKEKFAEIYWLFSRQAVSDNSIQKFTDSLPKLKGKKAAAPKDLAGAIDDSFLEYIDNIREELAKAFKKNDESLDSEALTEAVTRTVDRLVFIRFLEDKLIEPANHVSEWRGWTDFIADSRKLDVKYNGVVFKEHPLLDKKGFAGAEEKMFLDICSDISNRNSPYDFNYIPIHILGSIYERFLGKVVIATDKRARIEEKPEVRKAGGVYYTPKYIVDYIVQNTVGKMVEGKTPKQIDALRFADIACGSGSFLIGVYDCLLDYHKKYYTEKLKDKTELDGRSEDFGNVEYKDGQWLLTLKRKQEILLNNIYGVDIDRQAVEVTQLSLFLKMLEDETLASTQVRQGALFSKVLPDLSKNIVCGNSLIGTDILAGQLFSFEEEKKLNPMDFETAFPAVMRNGGFDAIVGNPPYVQQSMFDWFNTPVKKYLLNNYCSSMGRLNTFGFFIEKAITTLKNNGSIGYIVPNTILSQEYYEELRKLILTKTHINEIVSYEKLQFKGAVVETVTILMVKSKTDKNVKVSLLDKDFKFSSKKIPASIFHEAYKKQFIVAGNESLIKFQKKIDSNCTLLGKLTHINQGIALKSDRAAHLFENKKNDTYKPILDGREINRYSLNWDGKFLKYDVNTIHSCKREDIFNTSEKIIFRRVSATLVATLDKKKYYTLNTLVVVNLNQICDYNISFLLALFNSKFLNWYFITFLKSTKKVFSEIQARQVEQLPIPIISINIKADKSLHDQLVTFVTQMLDAKKQLATAQTEGDKTFLENKCTGIDRQIDNLVYQLYGLTEEEIKIVEGS
jgi:adenine-specific DNA-methyltransferase